MTKLDARFDFACTAGASSLPYVVAFSRVFFVLFDLVLVRWLAGGGGGYHGALSAVYVRSCSDHVVWLSIRVWVLFQLTASVRAVCVSDDDSCS